MEFPSRPALAFAVCCLAAAAVTARAQEPVEKGYLPPAGKTWNQLSYEYWTWYPADPALKFGEDGGCIAYRGNLTNMRQSPIRLDPDGAPRGNAFNGGAIGFQYGSAKTSLTLTNNGHTVELELDPEAGRSRRCAGSSPGKPCPTTRNLF